MGYDARIDIEVLMHERGDVTEARAQLVLNHWPARDTRKAVAAALRELADELVEDED